MKCTSSFLLNIYLIGCVYQNLTKERVMNTVVRHLSNLLSGANFIFEAPHKQRKYKSPANGFHEDQYNLRGDARMVGNDIRSKAKEAYGR